MKPTAPCYGCKDRRGGCHGGCERYAAFQTANEAYKAKVFAEKAEEQMINDYRIRRHCVIHEKKVRER